MLKLFVDVEGILSGSHGNFEERNKVMEPSIIIITLLLLLLMLIIVIV